MSSSGLPPVLIVGVGLIGGSVGLALRRHGVKVRGVTRDPRALSKAIEKGAIEGGSTDLHSEVPGAGVIVLAAPTRASIRMVKEVGLLAREGTVITDACSSKGEVVRAMSSLPPHVRAVGGHPMAGKEKSGVEAAEADLFQRTVWALTPTERTDDEARLVCEALARACGARPLWTTADEHDKAVALISHVPLLTSAALVLAAMHNGSELAWELASSGFRDTTRLAAGDPAMGADLLLTNAEQIAHASAAFQHELTAMVGALQMLDADALTTLLTEACERRRRMFTDR